jgi:hypothetical protein
VIQHEIAALAHRIADRNPKLAGEVVIAGPGPPHLVVDPREREVSFEIGCSSFLARFSCHSASPPRTERLAGFMPPVPSWMEKGMSMKCSAHRSMLLNDDVPRMHFGGVKLICPKHKG